MYKQSMRFVALLISVLLLAACERHAKTPEFFLLHPEYIQPVYDQCVMTDSPSDRRSMECVAVMTVIPVLKQYLSELMVSRTQYGSKIMHAQWRLVELQKKVRALDYQLKEYSANDEQFQKIQAQKDQLQQEIYRQELLINSRRAVLRVTQNIS